MIQTLRTSYLLTGELKITGQRLADIVMETLSDESFFQGLGNLIQKDVDLLERATARSRGNAFTARLAEADEARDEAFVAFRDYAKAISGRRSDTLANAGAFLFSLIEVRGVSLHRLGYAQQSAAMNELLDDLNTPEAVAAIEVIGGQAWFDELRETHEAFEETYQEKVAVESQEDIPQTHTIRKNLSANLETLLSALEALSQIWDGTAKEAKINQLIAQVDEIVTEIGTTAQTRRTRQANSEASKTEPLTVGSN